jgi:hypothetical protein
MLHVCGKVIVFLNHENTFCSHPSLSSAASVENLLRTNMCLAGVAGATQLAADLANFNISKVLYPDS